METARRASLIEAGEEALRTGHWETARASFEAALADHESPEAEEGLGRALWWLQDVGGSIHHHERAYVRFRERGEAERAAAVAIWLAREYAAAYGNAAASGGWYARAVGLIGDAGPSREQGWLALTRAERAAAPAEMRKHAEEALELGRRFSDPDLEVSALARIGYAEVASGDVESGMARVDEAMAAALGGEVARLETVGDVCCTAVAACEHASDWPRIEEWGRVVEAWVRNHKHVPLVGFCTSCCAEMFVASGRWDEADAMYAEALAGLRGEGHRARCVHPAAKLAELRLLQGRFEEAEELLVGYEEAPEAIQAVASLHLARGEAAMATAVLHRRLNRTGRDNVLAAPHLALLVEVQLARGERDEARETAMALERVARQSGIPRIAAEAALAEGRVALAAGDSDATSRLEEAMARFAEQGMALKAACTRLLLARAVPADQREVALAEARRALQEFERLGAPRDADEAAAFLRRHGARGRTGPKDVGLLTRREREILDLLAEGLTNAEIAARLYVSTKTVGHHVSRILAKLGVRSRGEAAAYALRNLPDSRAEK